jgi:release factor glutamine methyltransferase
MTIQDAYKQLMYQLYELYDDREAANIADMVIEHITGLKRIDRIMHKQLLLNKQQEELFVQYSSKLLKQIPVQYVLHEAWFAGLQLYVDENVLIPRPETEELVEWVFEESKKSKVKTQKMLDIGTGSGCIPVALKKKLPAVDMHAIDVSERALVVAQKNAHTQNAGIIFYHADILDKGKWNTLPNFDIIVSNPPYIKQKEKNEMQQNVLAHEPHIALFVPDEDALLFYKIIAEFGLQHLGNDSKLFFEINEAFGKEVCALLSQSGYSNIELRKDLQGKDRMVMAMASPLH